MKRIVPGIHSVFEALRTRPESVSELQMRDDYQSEELKKLEEIANKNKIKINRMSSRRMDQVVATHQGVIATVTDAPSWPDSKRLSECKKSVILVCDSIEDPHNFGSLVRTSWNLGVAGVIYNKDRSAGLSPSAQKVASGGFEHVPVLGVANIAAEIKVLKELGFWAYGLEEKAENVISEVSLASKTILVLGAEESGLRKTTRDVCDDFLSIPSTASSNSLNVAVAGGIAIYETKRQQKN